MRVRLLQREARKPIAKRCVIISVCPFVCNYASNNNAASRGFRPNFAMHYYYLLLLLLLHMADEQAGFRKDRSTVQQLSLIHI